MKHFFLILTMASVSVVATAQTGVGVNTTTPAATAALDVTSTTQGMLVPRMLSSQRTAIGAPGSPATGLLVYQTDAPSGFYFYNGTAWVSLSSAAAGGTAGGDLTGSYPNPTLSISAGTGANAVSAINTSSSTIDAARLQSTVTTQGNSFNTASKLVQLNGSAALPAVSGANLTNLNASSISSGTVALANGGTGQASANASLNALLPAQAGNAGKVLTTDGSNTSWASSGKGYTISGTIYPNATTYYNGLGNPSFQVGANNVPNSGSEIAVPISYRGTMDSLYMSGYCNVGPISSASNTITGTIYKNGVSTGIAVSLSLPGTTTVHTMFSLNDLVHSVSFVPGDSFYIRWDISNYTNGALAIFVYSIHVH